MPTINLGRRELKALTDAARDGRAVTLCAEEGKPDAGVRFTPGEAVTFFDSKVKGFGVRFHASRKAAFILEYRPVNGGRDAPKKRITIAAVGTMTLEDAKQVAKDMRAEVRLGRDPMEERQAARRAETLSQLIRAYLDEHVKPKRKPATLALYEGYLKSFIAPRQDKKDPSSPLLPGALGGKKAIALTRQDVAKLHREMGKTQPRTANATVTLIAAAYAWGAKHGALPEDHRNPAKAIERFPENSRERFLKTEEFARLGETLRLAETEGLMWGPRPGPKAKHAPKEKNRHVMVDPFAVAAVRLLIFTGARLREILHLEWSQVDTERGLAFLPDSKTGKKPLILTAPALEVLAGLPRVGRYVIASESAGAKDETPRADLHRPWARITAHAKLSDLRIHDLRHSFASVGVGGGMGLPIVGKLLGHADVKTTQKYSHLETDPVRRAGDAIALKIQAQMTGKSAAVIPMHGRDS
ncbi:MAG: site-specific integrase [Hyphomonadaceae bacterium]|nr:site-specific integrase [Hyphomonadaceae bacterium]